MNILGILCELNNNIVAYSKEAMPWSTLRAVHGASIATTLVLDIPNSKSLKFLCLEKLFSQYPDLPPTISNWDDLLISLEEIQLEEFFIKALVPSKFIDMVNNEPQVVSTQLYSTADGQLGYHTADKSLKILNSTMGKKDNLVVFINGVVCYSRCVDEQLVLYNTSVLANTENRDIKDTVILDFSDLGTLTKYKLSDCTKIYVSGLPTTSRAISDGEYLKSATAFTTYKQGSLGIVFYLPENAKPGIPILCLGGRLFFPRFDNLELFKTNNKYGIFFTINRDVLESIILVNLLKQTPTNSGIKIKRADLSDFLDKLFVNKITDILDTTKDCTIPHVIMLHANQPLMLQLTESISTFDRGAIRFPKKSYGMLIDKVTRELVDYTKIHYDSETLITVADSYNKYKGISSAPISYTAKKIGFGTHNYNEHDLYNPFNNKKTIAGLANLVLLDIAFDTDIEKDEDDGIPQEKPFGRIVLAPCGKLKKISKIPTNLIPYYKPIQIRINKNLIGKSLEVIKANDNITGSYIFLSGSGKTSIWVKSGTSSFQIKYNSILQAWTICDPDGSIKYQSSLSASFNVNSDVLEPTYADPWNTNLFWFQPINR